LHFSFLSDFNLDVYVFTAALALAYADSFSWVAGDVVACATSGCIAKIWPWAQGCQNTLDVDVESLHGLYTSIRSVKPQI
jgi:hypothetical protein